MVCKGILCFGHESREALLPAFLPEGPVSPCEHITAVRRCVIFSRISNREWLKIGIVFEKNTGISGSERMQSLRCDHKSKADKALHGNADILHRQNEMIDAMRFHHDLFSCAGAPPKHTRTIWTLEEPNQAP